MSLCDICQHECKDGTMEVDACSEFSQLETFCPCNNTWEYCNGNCEECPKNKVKMEVNNGKI